MWENVMASRGKRYVTCEFGNFEITTETQKKAVDHLRNFAGTLPGDRGLVLFGPVGTGKDHLLTALCRIAIMQHGLSLVWTTGPAICAAFREPMRYEDVTEHSVLHRFASPDVLAISDPVIAGGDLSKFETDKLYEVIDRRYSDRPPTWFTINVANRDKMITSLGAAIVDRLIDGAVTIRCDWPSHRKPSSLEAPQ
jgi:DNA replication protein DnaC